MSTDSLQLKKLWPLPIFLGVGFFAAWLASLLASRLGTGKGFLAVGTLIVALPMCLLGAVALRRGIRSLHGLLQNMAWWHWLWILAWTSGFVLRERDAHAIKDSPTDAAATYRIILVVCVGLVLLLRLGLRRTLWLRSLFRGLVAGVAVYAVFSVLTTLWSVYPALTLYKSLEYLIDVALLAAILVVVRSTEDYKQFFDWTWTLYAILLATVWIGLIVAPQLAWEHGFYTGALGHRLVGVLPEQDYNRVGDIGAMLSLIALSRLLSMAKRNVNRLGYIFVFLVSFAAVILSQTRSALAGFAFGALLLLLFSKRAGVPAFLVFAVIPIVVLSGAGAVVWTFLARGQQHAQLASLSGRMVWWVPAWHVFLLHPLGGLGAYAAGRFAVLAKLGYTNTSTLHSDYLEMLVGNGILGPVPVVVSLVGCWYVLIRSVRRFAVESMERQLTLEAIAILALLSVRSVLMTILVAHPPLHFLVVLGWAEFLRRRARVLVPASVPQPAFRAVASSWLDPAST